MFSAGVKCNLIHYIAVDWEQVMDANKWRIVDRKPSECSGICTEAIAARIERISLLAVWVTWPLAGANQQSLWCLHAATLECFIICWSTARNRSFASSQFVADRKISAEIIQIGPVTKSRRFQFSELFIAFYFFKLVGEEMKTCWHWIVTEKEWNFHSRVTEKFMWRTLGGDRSWIR